MPACDNCGKECTLPFTCQHCGGKFCPDCRSAACSRVYGDREWKKKPLPSVGMNYSKAGGVTATGGGYRESPRTTEKKTGRAVPWLKIMLAAIALIILGIAFLVLNGYAAR